MLDINYYDACINDPPCEPAPTQSSMYHCLHLGVDFDHPRPEIGMILHQNVRIPRSRHEYRVHAASNRRHEDLAHLQANQEGKGHDDGREPAPFVVSRFGELEVKEGKEAAEVGDEGAAHGEDGADEAVVDQSINAAILHHPVPPRQQPPTFHILQHWVTDFHVSLAAGTYAFPYNAMCEKA